jgi:predicted nucleic acid-binding protein
VAQEYGETTPDWISIMPVKDSYKTVLINKTLDLGESSTIALASEVDDPLVILDDGKARKYAEGIGLRMTGTLGVIRKVYDAGLVSDIDQILADLQAVHFRLPNDIKRRLET